MGKKTPSTLKELLAERELIKKNIEKTTSEIEAKRKYLVDLNAKNKALSEKINAKKYELILNKLASAENEDLNSLISDLESNDFDDTDNTDIEDNDEVEFVEKDIRKNDVSESSVSLGHTNYGLSDEKKKI